MSMVDAMRRLPLILAAVAALGLGACAKTQAVVEAGAPTPGSTRDFALNVGDRIFFETDSSDFTAVATATLDRQADWLQRYPRHLVAIEGHADERGTREYNFALGARRAQAVSEYLAARGVAAKRLRTISYGKERPVAVCNDISCWSQNRRAVTALEEAAAAF